jgi:hypothetical protein
LTNDDLDVLVLFMHGAADMRERHSAGLAELADMGLSLARDLHACALAAEPEAKGDLALAFQRVSRCVRQTYALESRLERERRLAERDIEQDAARKRLIRAQQRRKTVRAALSPLIWTEYEGDEAEAFDDALDDLLDQAFDDDAFLEDPLDACIARIREGLGLPANDSGDDEPPMTEAHIHRSSG